jgi:hypothetical protein
MHMSEVNESLLRFIGKDGSFRELSTIVEIVGRDAVLAANRTFLEETCGCETQRLLDEGFEFLLSFSLRSTFSEWGPDEEGRSGVSSRNVSKDTAGGWLVLKVLMQSHPAALSGGDLSVSYTNKTQGASRRR